MASRKGSQMLAEGPTAVLGGPESVATEMAGFAAKPLTTEMAGFADAPCRLGRPRGPTVIPAAFR